MCSVDPHHFRRVLGHLPTGVTVITAHAASGPAGITANSVTSVSLDPPLLLVCLARSSRNGQAILQAGQFCVNVLGADDTETCLRFARRAESDRFDGVAWHHRPAGPGLDGAVAWLECRICDQHPAGDHTIVVAEVEAIRAADGAVPLVFFRGAYGTFALTGVASAA
jgi:3-hydroxy-9,10-secoandrosta-1,3,5(10)-triene-9,17-dione monooxygenase reductase component